MTSAGKLWVHIARCRDMCLYDCALTCMIQDHAVQGGYGDGSAMMIAFATDTDVLVTIVTTATGPNGRFQNRRILSMIRLAGKAYICAEQGAPPWLCSLLLRCMSFHKLRESMAGLHACTLAGHLHRRVLQPALLALPIQAVLLTTSGMMSHLRTQQAMMHPRHPRLRTRPNKLTIQILSLTLSLRLILETMTFPSRSCLPMRRVEKSLILLYGQSLPAPPRP